MEKRTDHLVWVMETLVDNEWGEVDKLEHYSKVETDNSLDFEGPMISKRGFSYS